MGTTTSLTRASECTPCVAGKGCPAGTDSLLVQDCAPGYYCPGNSLSVKGTPCPGGYYRYRAGGQTENDCKEGLGDGEGHNCPAGEFCPPGSEIPMGKCPKGHECPVTTSYPVPCPKGKYQGDFGQTACLDCGYKSYCDEVGMFTYKVCPDSTYNNAANGNLNMVIMSDCLPCEAGFVCVGGEKRQTTLNYYSPPGSSLEYECPAGHNCPQETTAANAALPATNCSVNMLCEKGKGEVNCPSGWTCAVGAREQQPCLPGEVGGGIGACTDVPEGSYIDTVVTGTVKLCDPGYMCTGKSYKMEPCIEGTYQDEIGQNTCKNCPLGYYCPGGPTKEICPLGYFCRGYPTVVLPEKCPKGTYGADFGLTADVDCTDCPAGYFCSQKGLKAPDGPCAPGYVCTGKATIPTPTTAPEGGNVCPSGGYCEAGAITKAPCIPGTYNPDPLGRNMYDCKPCPPGDYCEGSSNTVDGQCKAGYYCPTGSYLENQNSAPPGYITAASAYEPDPCLSGTFTHEYNQIVCIAGPAGFIVTGLANDGSAGDNFRDCPKGQYCTGGDHIAKCLKGTYSPDLNAIADTTCRSCPPEKFCAIDGLEKPGSGVPGDTDECEAGYYCRLKAWSNKPSAEVETATEAYGPCKQGHYCTQGSSYPLPCSAGTYHLDVAVPLKMKSECTSCVRGKYCPESAMTTSTLDCDDGYFCNTGSLNARENICTPGHFCVAGSWAETQCIPGSYQYAYGQSVCLPCPAGFYCDTYGMSDYTPKICPTGHYCPINTKSSTQYKCGIGTYNPLTGATDPGFCINCPPGYWCGAQGLSVFNGVANTGICLQGYFCEPASTTEDPVSGICPIGSYCPTGSSRPILCDGGHYCDIKGLPAPPGECSNGYYCPIGATKQQPSNIAVDGGEECPAGYYCPQGTSFKIPCPPGTFNSLKGKHLLTHCLRCTDGYYCETPNAIVETNKCTAGYFCDAANYFGGGSPPFADEGRGFTVPNPAARICTIGNKCPLGSPAEVPCTDQVNYQDEIGQSVCKTCPPGYKCTTTGKSLCLNVVATRGDKLSVYCPSGDFNEVECPAGTYSLKDGASTSLDCKLCPPGHYCPNLVGAVGKIIPCPAGKYCLEGAEDAADSNHYKECTRGNYCPLGSTTPIPCPHGRFCGTLSLTTDVLTNAAHECTPGYFCKEGSVTATPSGGATGEPCPSGHFCLQGTTAPTPCPIGKFRSSTLGVDSNACVQCTEGYHCPEKGLSAPKSACPAGYFCRIETGSNKHYLCPAGARCEAGSVDYEPCPNKMYQPEPGHASCESCPPGYYCNNAGATDVLKATRAEIPQICSPGHYCPENSEQEIDCPMGTFNPREGGSGIDDCEKCTPGKYCATTGQDAVTGNCDAGFFCTLGAKVPDPSDNTGGQCPSGRYCVSGTYMPAKCPPGTYSDALKAQSDATCINCEPGHFCPFHAGTSRTIKFGTTVHKCHAGYLCVSGARIPNPEADTPVLVGGEGGHKCAKGYYCIEGTTVEEKCEAGTYNPWPGQDKCMECPPGYTCATDAVFAPTPCPKGQYCPVGTTSTTKFCEPGTYNPFFSMEKQEECLPCPPGKYCIGGLDVIGDGATADNGDCAAGYVCTGGSAYKEPSNVFSFGVGSSGKCPPGYVCPVACTGPIPCAIGYYNDQPLQTVCVICPPGKVCDELGIITPTKLCQPGHYCKLGAKHDRPTNFATEGGHLCDAGFYCPSGTITMKPCPDGYYEPRTGSYLCQVCPVGYFCPTDAAGTPTPTICPINHYCPAQVSAGIFCPSGTYTDQQGLEAATQCRYCPPGKYCTNGAITGDCDDGYYCDHGAKTSHDAIKQCPVGHYCTSGNPYPTPCARGKINIVPGKWLPTHCIDCDAGYYCLPGDINKLDCPKGYYCEAGYDEPAKCPIFKWNGNTKSVDDTACIDCDAGYFCNEDAIHDQTLFPCKVGFYCLKNTDSANVIQPIQCPAGQYRNTVGAAKPEDCPICPPGYYCPIGTVQPIPCEASYYCPEGSKNMTECEEGNWCPAVASVMTICPAAYYCKALAGIPTKCANGYYCPIQSIEPTRCPSGTMGTNIWQNVNESVSCRVCEPGFYSDNSDPEDVECKLCMPGYVCIGSTNTQFPTDSKTQGGYPCPVGGYCPIGSYEPIPCPVGTYNGITTQESVSSCLDCDSESFQNLQGQSSCQSCGSTSRAAPSGETCICRGIHRTFQMSDKTCICEPFYEAVKSEDDGDSLKDCQPLIFDRCTVAGDLRDANGDCVSKDHCPDCPNAKGTRAPGLGICQCEEVDTVNAYCDLNCRNDRKKAKVDFQGMITIVDPAGGSETISVSEKPGFFGVANCYTSGGTCKIVNADLGNEGYKANYQPPGILSTRRGRLMGEGRRRLFLPKVDVNETRELQTTGTSTGIRNPLFCLNLGDTMMFGMADSTHYPVYLKDSLINTNPDFDYGLFRELAVAIKNGTVVSTFSFTFGQAGIYVFGDSSNYEKQTIIGVMSESQKCSNEEMYAEPITYDSLLRLGVSQNADIIQTPDWGLIFGLLITLLFGVPMFIFFLALVNARAWSIHEAKKARYRLLNEEEDLEYWKQEGTKWDKANLKVQIGEKKQHLRDPHGYLARELPGIDVGELDMLIDSDDEPIVKHSPEQKKLMQTRMKENKEGLHETNPKVFQDIYSELQDHAQYLKNDFMQREGLDEENINRMFLETDQLKRAMREKLKNMGHRANVNLCFKDEDEEAKSDKSESGDEGDSADEAGDLAAREMDEKIDTALDDADVGDGENLKRHLEQLDEGKHKMITELKNRELEREKYLAELSKTDLTQIQKNELLKEFDANFKHIQSMMLMEEEKQEANLNRKLDERRNRRLKLSDKIEELQNQKELTKDRFNGEIRQVRKEREGKERKIEEDQEKEKVAELAKLEKTQADELEGIKSNFQAKLAREKDPDKVGIMLQKYKTDMARLEASLEKDNAKQRKDLLMKLEVRMQKKLKEVKDHHKNEEKSLKDRKEEAIGAFDKKIELIMSNINNKDLDAQVQKVLDKEEDADIEKDKELAIFQVEEDTIARMEEIEQAKEEELKILKEKMSKERKAEEIKLTEEQKRIEEELKEEAKDLEDQRRGLEEELGRATSTAERNRLIRELKEFEQNMSKRLLGERDKQTTALQERLKKRRKQREDRKNAIEEKYDVKMDAVEEQKKEEYKRATRHHNKEKLERLISNLKLCIFPHELPFAIEKLIDESQMAEVTDLLNEHFREKAEKLRKFLGKLFKDKSQAMNSVKGEMQEIKERLKGQERSGELTRKDYKRRMEDLESKERDHLRDVELDFSQKQTDVEEAISKNMDKKHADELVNMKAEQYKAKNDLLRKYITDDIVESILIGDEEDFQHEVDLYNEQLAAENEARAKEIEDRKNKILEIVEESEDKIRELDLQTKKLLDEQAIREKKREEKHRKEIIDRIAAEEAEMNKKGMSDHAKKLMLEAHMKEWDEITKVMEHERERQSQVMTQKLSMKLKQKESLKLEKEKKLLLLKERTKQAVDMKLTNLALGILKGDMSEIPKPVEKTPEELRDLRLAELDKQNDNSRSQIEKIKPLRGLEVEDQAKGGILSLMEKKELNLKDKKDPYNFTLLMEKVKNIDNTVNEFSGPQFKELIREFRIVMKMVKKLNKKNKQE